MFGMTKSFLKSNPQSHTSKSTSEPAMIGSKWDWAEADRTTQFVIGIAIGIIILIALFGNL